ncbi:hypothetical protein GCM10023196_036760 [Actinoallomurus vinaceus]|uniref:Uncharacterized protein n=1 Tax=Actinoallomurus vinaceus TaxID=1080074 RepID=A0ABP8U9D8_9ACTN
MENEVAKLVTYCEPLSISRPASEVADYCGLMTGWPVTHSKVSDRMSFVLLAWKGQRDDGDPSAFTCPRQMADGAVTSDLQRLARLASEVFNVVAGCIAGDHGEIRAVVSCPNEKIGCDSISLVVECFDAFLFGAPRGGVLAEPKCSQRDIWWNNFEE